jgi:GTP cyclohydrolase I
VASDLNVKHALSLLQDLMPKEPWQTQDMVDTAHRWCKMMESFARGAAPDFECTVFDNPGHDELVIVKDIQFAALCAHHLLPFFGTAHVGYIPAGKIIGLSKIPRLVHYLARGTWTQEGLTQSIANYLEELLKPVGVAVVLCDVTHTCMSVRGIKERASTTTTSSMKGAFYDHNKLARAEFFSLLNT